MTGSSPARSGPVASLVDVLRRPAVDGHWAPARVRLAIIALLLGGATGALTVVLGGSGLYRAALYVGLVALAIHYPAAISAQVIFGQFMVGALLLRADGIAFLFLAPALAGVVATAEVLADIGRLDSPLRIRLADPLRRAGVAATIGAGAFATVGFLGAIPGPGGLFAVAVAAVACAGLAARMLAGESHS